MAPIKCMLHDMKNTGNKRQATYYFGANTVKDLFFIDLMREFESTLANFKFMPVLASPQEDENWTGQVGLVTDAVQRNLKNTSECEAYLCGSPGMIDAAISQQNKRVCKKVICEHRDRGSSARGRNIRVRGRAVVQTFSVFHFSPPQNVINSSTA